jgi:hypothetical protein
MKKIILFSFCSLFTFHSSLAQQYGWIDLSANIPEQGGLSDVVFIGDTGWISGGDGKVYYTIDGGQSFTIHNLPANAGITESIAMRSTIEGYLVTTSGNVFHSLDAGNGNWQEIANTGGALFSVCFPPEPATTGFTCGNAGRIWSITGNNVNFSTNISTYTLTSVCFPVSSSEGFVAGEIMMHYLDGVWLDDLSYVGANYYNSVFFTDNLHGWAVGVNGKINFTINCYDWNGQLSPIEQTLNDVYFINSSEGWAVGQELLIHTTNGGSTWVAEAQNFTTGKILRAIFATDNQHVYVAGNDGTLLKYCEITGIETSTEKSFSIYPNPGRDFITLQFDDHRLISESITIVNLMGIKIKELNVTAQRQQLDIRDLPSGTYFVVLTDAERCYSKKLMIMK